MASLTEDLKTFLNTTITSEKDLTPENLFRLLDSQEREQTQLDTKLNTVTTATKETLKTALDASTTQQTELTRLDTCFQNTQTHLDSFSQDDAFLNKLKETESKLKILDRAKNYIKALLVASELSSQALDLVQSQPEKSAISYQQLVKFEQFITQQDAPQELSVHLAKCKTRLWEDLDAVLTKSFKETLEDLSWPQPIRPPYGPQLQPKLKAFEKAFHNLLMLQDPDPACILNPISLLLQGLSLRFRFHFETSKPTNRLDKPEWYLQHTKNTITSHLPFLMTTIQPILDGMQLNMSAKDQFIKGLLQDVQRKLTKSMPALLQQPNLLAHTMHEVLEFDKSLQDDFSYPIMDLSSTILENKEWFDTWFYAEKKFAQTRYDEIMLDRQAFDMEEDKDESSFDRTKSSTRLIHLLESITEAYQLVPNLSQRFMFFAEIQLNLLGQYHKRLASAVDSFEALSLIRSVPVPGALPDAVTGVMTASESGGTSSALYRLYRWWTSGRSIYDVLQDWNEDEFFLGIQYEINQSTESIQLMDSATQERNNMLRLSRLSESDQNGLFADAITAYDQLCLRMEKIFVKLPVKEWITNARAYSKKDIWWQPDSSNGSEMTDDLYRSLQDFRMAFQLMKRCLPETYFMAILRKTLQEIEDWYWRHIITQNQFSSAGALQLQTDMNLGLWKLCKKWVFKPENYMKRLKEAIHLLNVSFNSDDTPLSCDQLMKALSDTSQLETVQKILEKLDIEVLSNGEIRDVLRRRNDMLNSWS